MTDSGRFVDAKLFCLVSVLNATWEALVKGISHAKTQRRKEERKDIHDATNARDFAFLFASLREKSLIRKKPVRLVVKRCEVDV
jgi:hypothetical protein